MTDEPVTESRVEAARKALSAVCLECDGNEEQDRRIAEFEQAVSEKARDEAVALLRDWLSWESDPISSRTLGDIAGDTAHFLARLAASPTEEANRG